MRPRDQIHLGSIQAFIFYVYLKLFGGVLEIAASPRNWEEALGVTSNWVSRWLLGPRLLVNYSRDVKLTIEKTALRNRECEVRAMCYSRRFESSDSMFELPDSNRKKTKMIGIYFPADLALAVASYGISVQGIIPGNRTIAFIPRAM